MSRVSLVLFTVVLLLCASAAYLFFGEDPAEQRRGNRGARTVAVKVETVKNREFSDIVKALGTARARESVTLTSRVNDTVAKIFFTDGQIVKKGDMLIELTRDEEQAQLAEAEANLKEAEKQLARIENLVKQGNASKSTQETAVRRQAEAKYRLQAVLARLEDRIIRAPFDGVLGLRQVSAGSLINQNTPITTIDAIDRIKLDFSVPERFIGSLKTGQKVEASVDAYGGELFTGQVVSVDSRVDPVTRTITVRAEVDNAALKLRPGMLMTVELISRSWDSAYVSEMAILSSSNKQFVYVVNSDSKAERREVTLGLRRAGYVEIKSGVKIGDRVVTDGLMRMGRSGTQVKIVNEAEKSSSLLQKNEGAQL